MSDSEQAAEGLRQQVEKSKQAEELLKKLAAAGVLTECRAQLKVSGEGHELVKSRSGSIEQLRSHCSGFHRARNQP